MKNNFLIACLVTAIVLLNTNCTGDIPPPPAGTSFINPPPPPPPPPSSNAWCDANADITVELPINYARLNGSGFGGVGNAIQCRWQKISGPVSYSFENPHSLQTKVMNLEKGVYQFELTVTNSTGSEDKDTMTLKVEDATSSSKQVFFWDLNWQCPLGCTILVEDIDFYVPANNAFSVYIRRDFSSVWELIIPDTISTTGRYFYSLWGGSISIFENPDVTIYDNPEIKIVF